MKNILNIEQTIIYTSLRVNFIEGVSKALEIEKIAATIKMEETSNVIHELKISFTC